jgi:hypothetical protein
VAGSRRWSFATECRNTATTLDILKHTIESTSDPIMLSAAPETVHDAKANMYCFSKDAETKAPKFKKTVRCPPFPPVTKWHGWARIESLDLPPSFHRYRDMQGVPDYEDLGFQYAIVYEYVRKLPEQDIRTAQTQIDFFHTAGFLLYQFRVENWNQGRLVDMGDLFRPVDRLDSRLRTWRRDASVVFAESRCLGVTAWTGKRKGNRMEVDVSKGVRSDYAGSVECENEASIGRQEEGHGDQPSDEEDRPDSINYIPGE